MMGPLACSGVVGVRPFEDLLFGQGRERQMVSCIAMLGEQLRQRGTAWKPTKSFSQS
jgi:hypothetical protein